jgi:hypothetical protein
LSNGPDVTEEQLAEHVSFFGCDKDGGIGDAQIMWWSVAHAGAGWYIYCREYPDEGSAFLSAKPEPFPALLKLLQEQTKRDDKEAQS